MRPRKSSTEQVLIRSAQCFKSYGYTACSMGKLAEACDVSKAAFYYDFLGVQESERIPHDPVVQASGRYLCGVQPHLPQEYVRLAYERDELRNALLLAQMPEPSWRQQVLRGLLSLRQAPILAPLIRRIPYAWQRAFKRLISRGPLDE